MSGGNPDPNQGLYPHDIIIYPTYEGSTRHTKSDVLSLYLASHFVYLKKIVESIAQVGSPLQTAALIYPWAFLKLTP